VPAENARLRRLARRDRRFLAAVVAVAALAAPAGVVLAGRGSAPPVGCVRKLERGFMGGQTVTVCSRQPAGRALTGEHD